MPVRRLQNAEAFLCEAFVVIRGHMEQRVRPQLLRLPRQCHSMGRIVASAPAITGILSFTCLTASLISSACSSSLSTAFLRWCHPPQPHQFHFVPAFQKLLEQRLLYSASTVHRRNKCRWPLLQKQAVFSFSSHCLRLAHRLKFRQKAADQFPDCGGRFPQSPVRRESGASPARASAPSL